MALVAVVVVDMVVMRMAVMDLVMMEAVWEVAEATMIWAITTTFKFYTHERRRHWRQKLWSLW